jgi:hypothetical protein
MQGDKWQDFHDGFVKLEEIQQQITRTTRKGFLQADCNFADSEFVPIPKGPFCELPILEAAILKLREGPDEHLRAQVELLATRAGKKLGCPGEVSPLKFWLWNLFLHLRKTKSKHLFAPTHQVQIGDNPRSDLLKPLAGLTFYRDGGTITNVCVASAIFCSRLETKAVETSVSAQKKLHERTTSTPATIKLTERDKKILEVIQRGSKGPAYCRELDNAHIGPRREGAWKGAPSTYAAAYRVGEPWRHRIQDEKSKINRKAKLAKTRNSLAGE